MDIVEFFQLSSGKWFSHRTSHLLSTSKSEGGKSELVIETLTNTDPDVIKLCEQYQVDPTSALCANRIRWNGGVEGQEKQAGSTLLVAIANSENSKQGKLLRQVDTSNPLPAPGNYSIGEDDALTLVVEEGDALSEERLWFASPNLRLRTGIVRHPDGFCAASFCSEIRMGVTKPAQ